MANIAEKLADSLQTELLRAIAQYLINGYTADQFIARIRMIVKAL